MKRTLCNFDKVKSNKQYHTGNDFLTRIKSNVIPENKKCTVPGACEDMNERSSIRNAHFPMQISNIK